MSSELKPNAAAALVIMRKAADVFGTTVEEILGSKRTQHIADARAVSQYAVYTNVIKSCPKLAQTWKCNQASINKNMLKVRRHKLLLKVAQEL